MKLKIIETRIFDPDSLDLDLIEKLYEFAGQRFKRQFPLKPLVLGHGQFRIADMEPGKHWEYPYVISFLMDRLPKESKVLDCGAGRGLLQFYLSQLGYRVTSLDQRNFHSKKLNRLVSFLNRLGLPLRLPDDWIIKRSARHFKVSLDFCLSPIEEMPFEDETFESVLCISVLEHIPSDIRLKAIQEMIRVLKKGGYLILTFDYSPEGRGESLSFQELHKFLRFFEDCDSLDLFRIDDWDNYLKRVQEVIGGIDYTFVSLIVQKIF